MWNPSENTLHGAHVHYNGSHQGALIWRSYLKVFEVHHGKSDFQTGIRNAMSNRSMVEAKGNRSSYVNAAKAWVLRAVAANATVNTAA
jgi:hypothetical protein